MSIVIGQIKSRVTHTGRISITINFLTNPIWGTVIWICVRITSQFAWSWEYFNTSVYLFFSTTSRMSAQKPGRTFHWYTELFFRYWIHEKYIILCKELKNKEIYVCMYIYLTVFPNIYHNLSFDLLILDFSQF